MEILLLVLSRGACMLWGLSGGIIIAMGVAAFITAIGIIPRLLQKARIENHFFAVANAATLGTVFGTCCLLFDLYIPIGRFFVVVFGFFIGIFIGCLAAALTEIVSVFPVMMRRLNIKQGMRLFVFSFAFGKLVGALYYWLYPGFIVQS